MDYKRTAVFHQHGLGDGSYDASNGAYIDMCHSLTMMWLNHILSRNASSTNPETRLSAIFSGGVRTVKNLDITYHKAFKVVGGTKIGYTKDIVVAEEKMLFSQGLTVVPYGIPNSRYDKAALIHSLKHPKSMGVLYSVDYNDPRSLTKKTVGHTIGFARKMHKKGFQLVPSSNDISAFDSNFGEYRIPIESLSKWVGKWNKSYNAIFKKHTLFYVTKKNQLNLPPPDYDEPCPDYN